MPIDTIVYHFSLCATAEEILYKFPSLELSSINGAIYYYLTNRSLVDHYISGREAEADAVQQRI